MWHNQSVDFPCLCCRWSISELWRKADLQQIQFHFSSLNLKTMPLTFVVNSAPFPVLALLPTTHMHLGFWRTAVENVCIPLGRCIRKLTQLWYTKLHITTIIKCNVFRSHSHLICCQYYSWAGGFFCLSNCVFEEPGLQSYERTTFIMSPISTKGSLGVTKHWIHWAGKCWWDGELQAPQTPEDTLSCKFNLEKVCSDNPHVGYTMK